VSLWQWVLAGLGAWLAVSVLVSFAIAAALARIGSAAASELVEPTRTRRASASPRLAARLEQERA
jgi:hypothetical protein